MRVSRRGRRRHVAPLHHFTRAATLPPRANDVLHAQPRRHTLAAATRRPRSPLVVAPSHARAAGSGDTAAPVGLRALCDDWSQRGVPRLPCAALAATDLCRRRLSLRRRVRETESCGGAHAAPIGDCLLGERHPHQRVVRAAARGVRRAAAQSGGAATERRGVALRAPSGGAVRARREVRRAPRRRRSCHRRRIGGVFLRRWAARRNRVDLSQLGGLGRLHPLRATGAAARGSAAPGNGARFLPRRPPRPPRRPLLPRGDRGGRHKVGVPSVGAPSKRARSRRRDGTQSF